MKILSVLIMLFGFWTSTNAMQTNDAATACTQPGLTKPIENWDIIATNTTLIQVNPYFTGSNLHYILTTTPLKPGNKVTIDYDTGVITVVANTKDNFNVTVTANNDCGTVNGFFNIVIDEEE